MRYNDPAAFTNAFNSQVQLGAQRRAADQAEQANAFAINRAQGIAALNASPAATPEQYIRAGDAATGNALGNLQAADAQEQATALPHAGAIASQVLRIQDPAQRRAAFEQAVNANSKLFETFGTPHDQAIAKIHGSTDDELTQTLTSLSQFAPQAKPEQVAAGSSLVQQQPGGGFTTVFSSPGKVSYEDIGGEKVPVDSSTGLQRPDIPNLKKTPTPYQQQTVGAPESMLSPGALDLAAQNYLTSGKLPTGLGRGAAAINAKVLTRAAQMASDDGDDAKAAVVHRYAFQATQKAQADTLKSFTSGKNGNTVRSLNVAVQHLDQLSGLADALGNGDVQLVNKLGNTWAKATGVAAPNSFEAMKKVVTDEIVKAIVGAGGGVADREEAAATISAQNSPAQLADVIKNYKGLMAGQLNGMRQQYTEGTGRNDFERFLLPTTKAELEKHTAAAAAPPVQNAPPSAAAPAQIGSDEEYARLPSGAQYIAPDGNIRTKR